MSGSMSVSDSRYILASKLAQFLRRNGYKIIDGSCKLSLTTSVLCLLNSLFFDSFNPESQSRLDLFDSSISGMYEDVKFLNDFMERTSSLKLFHGMQTLRGGVDLSHFTNLTVLELRKIPAHLIIGLNSLSVQLKALICSRSIYLLKELFGSTADEQNTTDVWTELKELNLSYNYLESLDNSIKSVPNLEILDLSHNNLKNIEDIQALKRLSCVNLSYNQLELLPVFNSLSCRYMSKLYIRNNYLERLDGLECLFNLEEFDVGYNLLSEYSVLSPLDKLMSLKMINLEGNPLFFHSQHVRLVINYINPFAINRGLYLNGKFIAIPQNLSHIMEKLEEELKCNICTEILIRPMVLNCSHMFCEYCITKWKKQQDRCPICRGRVESLIRVLALDVFIEKALEVVAPDENKAREELINQREQTKNNVM